MTTPQPAAGNASHRRGRLALTLALLAVLAAGAIAVRWWTRQAAPQHRDTEVPLGVEQAVIVRYSGPQLQAQPYRRGASVNLRIADQVQKGRVRVYDIRYVISLPGEFDLTRYLTSTDGRPIGDLPPFPVRGLTSLTKDIETRIQEIEQVGVSIGHWYYESLAALGLFWLAWLAGLIFLGRPKRPPALPPPPRQLSRVEQIDRLLAALNDGELTVPDKARFEALLLGHWRQGLKLSDQRMADCCREIEASRTWGAVYGKLQAWLHDPHSGIGAAELCADVRSSLLAEARFSPRNQQIAATADGRRSAADHVGGRPV